MIGIAALAIGIALGLVFHPSVPEVVQPYLPIAVVAALDAVFGGLRAYLERIFDPKVFVISFVFNVFVAALIVYVGDQLGVGTQLSTAIIVVLGIRIFGNAAALRRRLFGAGRHDPIELSVSQDPTDRDAGAAPDQAAPHGRHEQRGKHPRGGLSGMLRGGRSRLGFGTLAVLLCLLLGIAIVTQVRQTESGDSLDTARPADLLVLLDSLRQREGTLRSEVNELENTLNSLQASGNNDQAAIQSAQSRLAALSILVGAVGATGPGVTVTIEDPGPGVSPEAMLDVINELRAAGAEAIEVNDAHQSVRVGVDTWVAGAPGSLTVDSKTLSPAYSILAIGDPPTLAAAMNIPGGAQDTVKRVGARMSVQQADRVDVTTLRQPKPHQYAQPVK